MKETVLIIGGSSGLGLALAGLYKDSNDVIITGRRNPKVAGLLFKEFDLSGIDLAARVDSFVKNLPPIKTLVFAAGYFQDGRVTDLSEEQIEQMLDVGGRSLIYFVRTILLKQGQLAELITITSTSQWTPRAKEPIYNFVKAGAGHLSNAFAEDGRIAKVLVAGPAGMNTNFWSGVERDDLDSMLDPQWVAQKIVDLGKQDFRYKFVRILREPPRVEEVEER